jgi:hypothetical protein
MNVEKLDEIKISCRNCQNFVLFNKDHNSLRVLNRQGFCLYGQMEGDFSPYIGSSQAGTCKGYVFCSELNILWELEKDLRQKLANLLRAIQDRRTKEYKEIKPFLDGLQEYKEVKHAKSGDRYFTSWRIEEKIATKYFEREHIDEYKFLFHAVKLFKHDYNKFISRVMVEVHDQFCDCRKLELNLSKRGEEEPSKIEAN